MTATPEVPHGTYTGQPAPIPGPGDPTPPAFIDQMSEAYIAALRPLMALVGTSPEATFSEGFSVTAEAISFVSAVPVNGSTPIPVGDQPATSEWGWPVTVPFRTTEAKS